MVGREKTMKLTGNLTIEKFDSERTYVVRVTYGRDAAKTVTCQQTKNENMVGFHGIDLAMH